MSEAPLYMALDPVEGFLVDVCRPEPGVCMCVCEQAIYGKGLRGFGVWGLNYRGESLRFMILGFLVEVGARPSERRSLVGYSRPLPRSLRWP